MSFCRHLILLSIIRAHQVEGGYGIPLRSLRNGAQIFSNLLRFYETYMPVSGATTYEDVEWNISAWYLLTHSKSQSQAFALLMN